MRFTLTAGQRGDVPQAGPLIEGLPAEVVMADTAYDADHFRQAIADKVMEGQAVPSGQLVSTHLFGYVPTMKPDCVKLESSAARARPKSVILTRSTPFSRRMLAGLMSR